jgi:hypothetical protein
VATPVPNQRAATDVEQAEQGDDGPDLGRLDADLIAAGRYALAADLARATGQNPTSVAARALAAYGHALRRPISDIAAAFAEQATQIELDALADDRNAQLLAWSAAARAAIIAPAAGPADVLGSLAPCVADYPNLTEVGKALAEASRAGVVIIAQTADVVSDLASAEDQTQDLAAAAVELIDTAPRRTFAYRPAMAVYQSWVAPGGQLRPLLDIVAADSTKDLHHARDLVLALRGRGDKAIDETFEAQRRPQQRGRIIAGARHHLLQRYTEVLDLASQWVQAAGTVVDATARVQSDAWLATPLARLRKQLASVQGPCFTELAHLREADPGVAAAAAAAVTLLTETFAISDGAPPAGTEPKPAYVAHHELLASPLKLHQGTLEPAAGYDDPATADALVALASQPQRSPADTYQLRAQAGDHEATAALIAGVRATDASLATTLDRGRDGDVAELSASIDAEVTALSATIDSRRLNGALDESTWSAASARVSALGEPSRRDFGQIRVEIGELNQELEQSAARITAATLARIDERSTSDPRVAAEADRLREYTQRGEIASAEEYLEQLADGAKLPTHDSALDHLRRFFPAVPDVLSTHPRLLEELRVTLAAGPDTTPPTSVRALTTAVEADLSRLAVSRRENGARALGSWAALGRAGRKQVDATSALRAVLAEVGLAFADVTIHPTSSSAPGRQWATLTGVKGTGKALTPALGSQMSPDGATLRILLVRKAPTASTVIEWMSGERADQTVLALWLADQLSADDRRAFADAARGRPRPPVLLLGAAALAYLVVQDEPRLSTFGAIALPFTAASPFKDTPGDAAPEMFYGRTTELAAILDLAGSSTISGGRQIGKSALLRAAQRKFEDGVAHRAVLSSIFTVGQDDPGRLWATLWPKLAELDIVHERPAPGDLAEQVHSAVLRWLGEDTARALLILLDEADAFLDADAAGNTFTHVDWCRRLMQDSDRRAKVVFAGLHRTARFESLPNQPLAHLGRPVSVGPLRPQHAYDLLTRPLAALGFWFADPALPARVLALTNNMPALIQLFAATLVAQLTTHPIPADGPPSLITSTDVDAVLGDQRLMEDFREKYILTLNLDHRYLVIAYAVAHNAHEYGAGAAMSLSQLSTACRDAWPAGFAGAANDDFRALVTECVDLGLLAVAAGAYRMRTPTVLRLLGTADEVLDTLYSAQERLTVPTPNDATSYRRRLGSSDHRFPLTEAQLGQVMAPASKVIVIPGSSALGVERAASAIEQARKEEAGRVDALARLSNLTRQGLISAVGKLVGTHRMVVVDARDAAPAVVQTLLDTGDELVADASDPLSVVVVVTPDSAPAWAGSTTTMALRRFDQAGIRLWFDEESLPFRDADAVGEVLAATGGWPVLVSRLARAAHSDTAILSAEPALASLAEHLSSQAGAVGLVQGVGLSGHRNSEAGSIRHLLTRVFTEIVDIAGAGGADRATLCATLELTGLPDELAGSGLDIGAAVDTLTAIGCLYADDQTAALHPEPVLTAALELATGTARPAAGAR